MLNSGPNLKQSEAEGGGGSRSSFLHESRVFISEMLFVASPSGLGWSCVPKCFQIHMETSICSCLHGNLLSLNVITELQFIKRC